MCAGKENIKSYYFLHGVSGEEHWWGWVSYWSAAFPPAPVQGQDVFLLPKTWDLQQRAS